MVLHVLRALFVLLMAAVGWVYLQHPTQFWGQYTWLAMAVALAVGVLFISVDILSSRRKLVLFSGTFFGLLVGISIAYGLSFVVRLLVEQFMVAPGVPTQHTQQEFLQRREALIQFINLLVGVVSCYLAVSFILQTKDDFRFIIPYVEFSKQTKGSRQILLDTSVLIDGRIVDVAETGIFDTQLVVPRFVLDELQTLADSSDHLKRNRGRRGLDVLAKLRGVKRAEVAIYEATRETESEKDVDQKLLSLAKGLNARILSNDYNLGKVAQLREVDVINVNDMSSALKPVVLPGERMDVRIVKPGEEAGQGVGYLEDGTMVVVEHGRQHVNEEIEFVVTRALQTTAGRMIFGRLADPQSAARRPPRPRPDTHSPAAQGT